MEYIAFAWLSAGSEHDSLLMLYLWPLDGSCHMSSVACLIIARVLKVNCADSKVGHLGATNMPTAAKLSETTELTRHAMPVGSLG